MFIKIQLISIKQKMENIKRFRAKINFIFYKTNFQRIKFQLKLLYNNFINKVALRQLIKSVLIKFY